MVSQYEVQKLIGKITLFSKIVKIILELILRNQSILHTSSDVYIVRFTGDFDKTLLNQRLNFICSQRYVVNAYIVDQAGEESPGIKCLVYTDMHAAISGFQRILSSRISGDFCAVHVKDPVRVIPGKTNMMPLIISDYRFGNETLRNKPAGRWW